MATTILTLDCWHQGCDFHELLQGITLPGKVVFESDTTRWAEHNRLCHPPRTTTG